MGKLVGDLRPELEGRGNIAKALGDAAEFIGENAVGVSTGGGPTLGQRAAGITPRRAAAAQPYKLKDSPLLRRAVEDLVNLPAAAIPSLYVPAAGVVEAAQGRPERLKAFGKDIQETDPFYALVTGDPKEALRRAEQHPGYAALQGAGMLGVAGRGIGAAGRRAPSERVRRAASKQRPSRRVAGTAIEQRREYSPDVIQKAVQVLIDRGQGRRSASARRDAATAEPEVAARKLQAAERTDPRRVSDPELRRLVDDLMGANETIRRQNRARAVNEAGRAITNTQRPQGGPRQRVRTMAQNRRTRTEANAATSLITQGITRGSREDLVAFRRELEAEAPRLEGAKLQANKQLRSQIDQAVNSRADMGKVQAAAQRYAAEVIRPRTEELVKRGLLDRDQAERAPLMPYAVREMGARHEPAHWRDADGRRVTNAEMRELRERQGDSMVRSMVQHVPARLVDREGKPLTTQRIQEHMAANDRFAPAYVTQAPGTRGARNFFVNTAEPPRVGSTARTGEATRAGTFDADPDVLPEGAARAQGLIDAADGFGRFVRDFAARGSSDRPRTFQTRRQADNAARDLEATSGARFRAIRVNPFAGRQEQLQALLDKAESEGGAATRIDGTLPVRDALESALRGEGDGPWALVPEATAARMQEHLGIMGGTTGGKLLQLGSSSFRRTVLATSPTWLTGNIMEAALRSIIAGAGPRAWVTGSKVMRELERIDPKLAQELAARATGGGHFSMAEGQHIRRGAEQFEGTGAEGIARAAGAFWRAPGPKQAAGLWRAYTDVVFRGVNGRIEAQFQTAMLGKALRDSPLMSDRMLKTGEKAVEQAARGLTNTAEQVRFARQVKRMYGKYDSFSPTFRKWINGPTPFIAWGRNAVEFVYRTLPRDHPLVTTLIVTSERATEEWRKQHGLDLFSEDRVPPFLQGSIPLPGGGKLRLSRYTPFGIGDPLETAASMVLPQASGVIAAAKGEDWKGAKIRKADGSPGDFIDNVRAAAASQAEATVPVLGIGKRVVEQGPGALNPFRPVKPPKGKGGAVMPAGREGELLRREADAVSQATSERELELLRREADLLSRQAR